MYRQLAPFLGLRLRPGGELVPPVPVVIGAHLGGHLAVIPEIVAIKIATTDALSETSSIVFLLALVNRTRARLHLRRTRLASDVVTGTPALRRNWGGGAAPPEVTHEFASKTRPRVIFVELCIQAMAAAAANTLQMPVAAPVTLSDHCRAFTRGTRRGHTRNIGVHRGKCAIRRRREGEMVGDADHEGDRGDERTHNDELAAWGGLADQCDVGGGADGFVTGGHLVVRCGEARCGCGSSASVPAGWAEPRVAR